jgi:3-oxoacyl-[acyl-carrier protein] reductase
MRLKNRVAIVTGGGQGIGRAICLTFAREGARIAIAEQNRASAEAVAEEVRAFGIGAIAIHTDVSDGDAVRVMVSQTLSTFERIDILVNNAGIFSHTPIEECTEAEWDRIMAVNLKGPFLCSQAVMEIMRKQKSGRIINLGSIAGRVGGLFASAPYASSKAGVMCLTKSFARHLGQYGITINAIAPGVAKTEMTKDHPEMTPQIPLGRVADPQEVANVALFLASDEGSYLTGVIIDVNGGMLMP